MKRSFFFLFASLLTLVSQAQTVTLKITEGLNSKPTLKAKAEKEISKLLTEFYTAAENNRRLNLSGINMTEKGKQELKNLYDYLPFTCDDQQYSERCFQTVTGYCIRGILVTIKPLPDFTDERERELTISFDADGQITGAVFSVNDAKAIMGNAIEVNDVMRRNEILNFIETYRSWYVAKDLEMLEMFFSDDGLALTGGTIQRKSEENSLKDAVHYKIQDKQAFLSHLNRIFVGNMFTNVKFSDIEVMRHPMRKDIYLVTLHQDWASSNYKGIGYHDTGFLQLFWQFSDQGKDPLILFRSWHPDELINGDKGQLFSFEDINIIPIN